MFDTILANSFCVLIKNVGFIELRGLLFGDECFLKEISSKKMRKIKKFGHLPLLFCPF